MTDSDDHPHGDRNSRHRSVEDVDPATRERMTALARSFPSLEAADGIDPFDPDVLCEWVTSKDILGGTMWSAGFLLSVWNRNHEEILWDMHAALKAWSDEDKAAFQAWVDDPWWP